MKLIGKATLRLNDAKTGRVMFEESHSNDVTPALARILGDNLAGSLDYSKLLPIYNKLLGGVCLFDGTVSSSDIFLPKAEDASLTAHAGQTYDASYATNDRKVGQPDLSPTSGSRKIPNGYFWRWTWGQNMGNGRISNVCLTHSDTGSFWTDATPNNMNLFYPLEDVSNYIINGNEFTYSNATPAPEDLPQLVGINHQKRIPLGFYGDKNHVVSVELEATSQQTIYEHYWRGGNLNIYISKFTGTGIWLWNEVGEIEEEEKIVVSLPPMVNGIWQQGNFDDLGLCRFFVAYDESNKHLYIIWGGCRESDFWEDPPDDCNRAYWATGNAIYYRDYDLQTGNYQSRSISCLANNALLMFRFPDEDYDVLQLQVENGCIFLPLYVQATRGSGSDIRRDYNPNASESSWQGLHGVRLNLRTARVEDYIDGYMASYGSNAKSYTGHIDLGNERSMFPDCLIEKRASTVSVELGNDINGGAVYGDSLFYTNSIPRDTQLFGTTSRENRSFASSTNSPIQFFTIAKGNGVTGDKIRGCVLNKLYSATNYAITPVLKTSSQTMTLEYTLTQAQGAGT